MAKMGYTFHVNLVYSCLNSVFNILNITTMQYRFLPIKHLILEIEPSEFLKIFLRFWKFEPHFLINFFLIKNM